MKKQISRRTFIKRSFAGVAVAAMYGFGGGSKVVKAQGLGSVVKMESLAKNGNILIAYFSHTGNTRYMANQIHACVGGEIVEIKTVKPYTGNNSTLHRIAKEEKRRRFRPELATLMPDPAWYDLIFIGYPCWWHTMPMAVFAFIEQVDLSGKVVVPFTTHGGSGWGEGNSDMRALSPQATFAEGLALYGSRVKNTSSTRKIENWLSELGFPNSSPKT